MDRREFFRKTVRIGAAAGAAAILSKTDFLFGLDKPASALEMAAVGGENPKRCLTRELRLSEEWVIL